MNSRDFGRISIFAEHSLVELPADLPMEVFHALDQTRVSGQLINIEPDPGAPAGRPGSHKRQHRNDRGDSNDRGDRGGRGGRGGHGGRGGRNRRDDRGGRGFKSDRGHRGGRR